MSPLEKQAAKYAESYPAEIRELITQAWLDGRRSKLKKAELDLSFVEDQYREIFDYWLEYKKERKQTYTQKGAEACYYHLVKLSGGDRTTMVAIIEQSCANNWAGLFELKNNGTRNNQERRRNQSIFDAADFVLQNGG